MTCRQTTYQDKMRRLGLCVQCGCEITETYYIITTGETKKYKKCWLCRDKAKAQQDRLKAKRKEMF